MAIDLINVRGISVSHNSICNVYIYCVFYNDLIGNAELFFIYEYSVNKKHRFSWAKKWLKYTGFIWTSDIRDFTKLKLLIKTYVVSENIVMSL